MFSCVETGYLVCIFGSTFFGNEVYKNINERELKEVREELERVKKENHLLKFGYDKEIADNDSPPHLIQAPPMLHQYALEETRGQPIPPDYSPLNERPK
jgi:hypothetical protein